MARFNIILTVKKTSVKPLSVKITKWSNTLKHVQM